MKKALLLLLPCMLAFASCKVHIIPEKPSPDAGLEGEAVDARALSGFKKLFVLNEGQMGAGNASLDMLRLSDSNYITGVFRKMNPDVAAGLGDVGNDIAAVGDELWITVNNSGIVEVLDAKDETEIAAIPVPMPRCLAFDDKYVYVSSWNGAAAIFGSDWSVDLEKSKNPKGVVYRIDRKTRQLDGSVEVGYQPEGMAVYDGKLYVANSGGISSQLPPAYAYDNTLSIIDTKSFTLYSTVEVEVNLKNVYSDGKGAIYVTSLGNYMDVHTGLYCLMASNPALAFKIGNGSAVKPESLHISCSCICDGVVYCIGTENEFDWNAVHQYNIWSCSISDYTDMKYVLRLFPQTLSGNPYGMAVLESHGSHYMVLGDAGDYYNPGTVSCRALDFNDGEVYWKVTSGVCPGHFAVW